ncbi:Pentatricopeptide repeat-containing protein [Actinidia chinensis var. chinensis]|uniref:Pentatricopeptide repeat-containing protein n=1 Tax=Actinidia chinensis var. chinensis TaxID=1590841 RepID=A0A2R6PIM5_ACTCC|nr:Pentatricopeptide repeat-containing protein [Actinidia chinensis var. chinensis]
MAEKNRTYSLLSVPLNHPPRIIPSSSQTPIQNPQKFPNYLENPDVSPVGRVLCEIITKTPPEGVETALSSTRIKPNSEIVEEVLKHSYGSPSAAVKFFRWAGMVQKHSGNAWTLLVDLLGKNGMFELMWDTIRSMKQEGLLTMRTFVLVFGCYCNAGKFNEAVMAFDLMERYGIKPDVGAVNSLLRAICREDKQTFKAIEFFERIKTKITPDGDTFAILLEGWEKEGNVAKAKNTFGEMVIQVGWSPQNMPAYDAFLTTLVCGSQMDEAMTFLRIMKGKNCFPGLKFFSNALDILIKQNNSAHVVFLWDMIVGSGLLPNLKMFNAMIGLLCNHNDIDGAFRVLDEIVFYGVFPDSLSYNMIFQCLIKNKKVREAGKFFFEMTKNEWPPTHSNCSAAITMFFNGYDPQMAIEVWDYMMKNRILPLEESANLLLIGLCDMGRLTELRRFADKILDRRIAIYESTMEKLKHAFYKRDTSARETYDSLSRKWKSFQLL